MIGKALLCGWLVGCAGLSSAAAAAPHPKSVADVDRPRVRLLDDVFRLDRTEDLLRLEGRLEERSAREAARLKEWQEQRDETFSGRSLAGLSRDELKSYFHPPEELLTSRELRCLEQIRQRARFLLAEPGPGEQTALQKELLELAAALDNTRRDPVPRMDMFSVPFLAFDFLDNSIGGGEREAVNVAAMEGIDSSQVDPPQSLFWTGERPIEEQDLFAGFGRESQPDWGSLIWEYAGPKLSAGSTPGLEVRHGRWRAKLKFRETKSEPFTARLFHALGYFVDPTDHVRQLRVRYNPRLLREMNLRRELMMHFRLVGPPLVSLDLQKPCDPLDFVEAAVLHDGTRLSVEELRQRLRPAGVDAAMLPDTGDRDFESLIDHLVFAPVNFQIENPEWKSVGRWDYAQLGHDELRELRGVGLLAAWLGWFDCRFDNTSLRVDTDAEGAGGLRACFSDLGAGLGRSDWGFGWSPESVNEFPWEFTRAPVERGPGRMRTPFCVVRFHTIVDNPAFNAMTEVDARWMGRRIARLTREQLTGALIASGHDAAETVLYLAKLISRRDRLVLDLGLESEHGLLGDRAGPRAFDYDPHLAGLPEVRVGSVFHRPPGGSQVIVNGRLMPRSAGQLTSLARDE